MWEILKYILLGIVQGITEILPISSSGHLVLFQEIINLKEPGLVFEMFTNMASFLALLLLFHKDILKLIKSFFLYLFTKENALYKNDFKYVIKLLIVVIPIGIFGLLFKDQMANIKNILTVGIALFITGSLLLTIYFTRNKIKDREEITYKDALIMGLVQSFAIFPGISRSGSTIIGGRASKVSLNSILKFSFLAYIIISIPTSALGIYDLIKLNESINIIGYTLAFLATFVTTFITAYLVMKKLKVEHMKYFGFYCLAVGLISIIIFII